MPALTFAEFPPPRWDGARRLLLCAHIILSCAGSAFALTHGFTALWY